MSFKTTGFALLVAAIAAGGGYAAWKYYGHGCCRAVAGADEPKAAGTTPGLDDATLIASQGYCPVMPDTKLGEMGEPIKLMVKGKDGKEEPVFICCKGCKRKVLADPDKALAKVTELRAAAGK